MLARSVGDERVEVLERPQLGVQRVVAAGLVADRVRAAGVARARRRACCCGPCGSCARSGGRAGSTGRRSRARRAAGPARPRRAGRPRSAGTARTRRRSAPRSRSTSSGSGGSSCSCLATRSGAASTSAATSASRAARTSPSLERVGDRGSAARSAAPVARPAASRRSTTPSDASPARSAWPASILRLSSSRQEAKGSVHAADRVLPAARAAVDLEAARPADALVMGVDGVSGASRQRAAAGRLPADLGAQHVVAVAEDVDRDVDDVADGPLDRPAAAVDDRGRVLDADARQALASALGRASADPFPSPGGPQRELRMTASAARERRAAPRDLAARPGGSGRTRTRSSTGWRRPGQRFWQVLPLGPPDRHGSPYKSASAFAAWRGLLHDPGARGRRRRDRGASASATPTGSRLGGARRRLARGGRPGALRPRVGGAARARRAARRQPLRRRADLRRARQRRPARPSRALPRRRGRRRAARRLLRQGAALGQPALRLARAPAPAGTAGGSSGCAARSSWSTSRASTTSAAFVAYWAVPAGAATRAAGAGARARARASSTPRSATLGELPVVAEDLGVITPAGARGCATGSASRAWWCCSSPSTPRTPTARTGLEQPREHQVLYTGTHDNDTLRGWWDDAGRARRRRSRASCGAAGIDEGEVGWALVRLALGSRRRLVHGAGPGRARARLRGADERPGPHRRATGGGAWSRGSSASEAERLGAMTRAAGRAG